MYYKLGQACVTNWGSFVLLQIRANIVTNWGSYYKLGQLLLQNRAAITNWGKMYHKLGHNTDFNNASFIIDCYTYILFNLNPFILEQRIDDKNDRDFVETLWN